MGRDVYVPTHRSLQVAALGFYSWLNMPCKMLMSVSFRLKQGGAQLQGLALATGLHIIRPDV